MIKESELEGKYKSKELGGMSESQKDFINLLNKNNRNSFKCGNIIYKPPKLYEIVLFFVVVIILIMLLIKLGIWLF